MGDTLARAESFMLHSTATIDEQVDSGQMVQFSRDSTITIQRPDKLQADVRHGPDLYRIWHRGDELTVLDVRRDRYAVARTPTPIDKMLDSLAEEHGVIVPLEDLLFADPYAVLTENVESGVYVDQQEVGGRVCDHLLFTQQNVDWQIWIDAGAPAVPRKVVITYKNDPGQPQYEAVLGEWQFDLKADSARFSPQVPASARLVEMADLATEEGEGE
jgi:hypothetical protein